MLKNRQLPLRLWLRSVQQLLLMGVALLCSLICTQAFAETNRSSKTLEQVRLRGVVNIGVKTDFAPFGMLDPKGEPVGLEVDLAADLARQLGVRLNKVIVTTENRFQKLEQGIVDVLIATAADTFERRQIATAIEPNYYAGGVTVFMRPEQHISDWQAVRGQKICATQGAYFNRPMTQRYLLDLQMYRSTRDALLGLHDGRCIGFLYSSAAVQAYLKKPEWAGYKTPLPIAMIAPWAIHIANDDKNTDFEHLLGDIVANWHRDGFLIEREKAWDVQETKFLKDTRALWTKRNEAGQLVCQRMADGNWPTECRNLTFVRSDEVAGLLKFGLWLEENTGMKLTFMYDPYDRSILLKGMFYSFVLMGCSVLLSLILGASGAVLVESRFVWLGRLVRATAVYGRMTPPLLQMYMLFFGVGSLLIARASDSFSPFPVAVWCLSIYTGASVMNSFLESCNHLRFKNPNFRLNFSNLTALIETSAVPVKAALTNVVKQSVLASALAVPELLTAATSIMSDQGNVAVMMNIFLLIFLLYISIWMKILDWLENTLIKTRAAS